MKFKFTFTFLLLIFAYFNANAASVEQLLKVKITPFEAIDCHFSYSLDDNSYAINTELTTAGMFGKIYPFSGRYSAEGKIKNGDFIQEKYESRTKSRFNRRKSNLIYNENGVLTERISEKNGKKKIFPVKNQISTESINLPTVFAKLIKQLQVDGNCASTYTVFNGKRSFQVVFADYGQESSETKDTATNNNISTKCSMYIESEEYTDNLLFNASVGSPVMFWIKKDEQTGLPYIEKIEAKYSKFGYITVQSAKINIRR